MINLTGLWENNKDKFITVGSVVGVLGSVAATIWGTRKATKKAIVNDIYGKEEFKQTWYYYLPGTILSLLSATGIIMLDISAEQKMTSMVVEYIALRSMLDNVRDNIADEYGAEKADEIIKKSAQPGIGKNYVGIELDEDKTFDKHGPDDRLFVDSYTGAEFYAQLSFMQLAREALNQKFAFQDGFATFEDWYGYLGEEIPIQFLKDEGCTELIWDSINDVQWIGIHYRLVDDMDTGNMYYSIEYEWEPMDGIDYGCTYPREV